jgi:hypothetical protein
VIDSETPSARLRRKLAEAMAEPWDPTGELRADLSLTESGPTLAGTLVFNARRSDGKWVTAHQARIDGLATATDVDDFLAETLSKLLAAHPAWLR